MSSFRLVAIACSFGIAVGSVEAPAQVAALSAGAQVQNGEPDPVEIPVACWGFVPGDGWLLNFMDMNLYVDGQTLGSAYQEDYWDMEATLSAEVQIDRQDRTLSCTLSSGWGSDQVSLVLERRYPAALQVLSTVGGTSGWGNYESTRHRQVRDNYAKPYSYAGTPVGENCWINPSENGCNIVEIRTGSYCDWRVTR